MTSNTHSEIDYVSEADKSMIYEFNYFFGNIINDLTFVIENQSCPVTVINYIDFERKIRIFFPRISDLNIMNFCTFLREFYESKDQKDIFSMATLLTYMLYEFGINAFGYDYFIASIPKKLISLEAKVRMASLGITIHTTRQVDTVMQS